MDLSVLLPRQDRQWLETPGLRMSGLCSPRPELRGARKKEGHMGAGDRKEKHSFELQEGGSQSIYTGFN